MTGIPVGTISSWERDRLAAQPPPQAVRLVPPPDAEEDVATDDGEQLGRAHELPPQRPPDGRIQPVDLNYREISDYIEAFYSLAGRLAQESDEAMGIAVQQHAAKAGEAWSHWIQSEPKVAAFLQKLMIGTPMGEVIGVHVSIIVAYFLSRGIVRAAAEERARAAEDGASPDASPDLVVGVSG